MAGKVIIHWFRQDLRLRDNAALSAAAQAADVVVPVYVLDERSAGIWRPGGASRWWLDGSLRSLDRSLREAGSRLVLRRGAAVQELIALAKECGAEAIHCTRCYEPYARQLEKDLRAAGQAAGIEVKRFGGGLLREPEAIRNGAGQPYRVFTPFWRALRAAYRSSGNGGETARLGAPGRWPKTEKIEAWKLRPASPDWAGGLRITWQPGEAGALALLDRLVDEVLRDYPRSRDRPDVAGTSMLSPHLHFGEISPAQVWRSVEMAASRSPECAAGCEAFLREIGWRDFCHHLLFHWPEIADHPFRPEFATFSWAESGDIRERHLRAWQRGTTGYPIVDAGMRQLWLTGFMHNRVRMVAASFLTKHLLIPWQDGAAWFWDTLVDADLANNSGNWQWVAGSGADAAPYFRVFNPVLQGAKFDPAGAYVREFVPELSGLDDSDIHQPWSVPADRLAAAGVVLGETYPRPIVDHGEARARALAAYSKIRGVRT
jgi:deoxyribodipyrimidine photo-lyase